MILFREDCLLIHRKNGTNDTIYYPMKETTDILRSSHAFNFYEDPEHVALTPTTESVEYFNAIVRYDSVQRLFVWLDVSHGLIKLVKASDTQTIYTFPLKTNPLMGDMVLNVQKSVLVIPVLGRKPRLEQCNYDGTNHTVLYSRSHPVLQLTVDYQTQRYFFVDVSNNSLYSIDFDGREDIYHMRLPTYFSQTRSFQVFNHDLYFMTKSYVYKWFEIRDIVNGSGSYTYVSLELLKNSPDFLGFVIVRPHQSYHDKCSNNKCSHPCYPLENTYGCGCPSDYVLQDQYDCQPLGENTRRPAEEVMESIDKEIQQSASLLRSSDQESELTMLKLDIERLETSSAKNRNFIIFNFIIILIIVISAVVAYM